MTYNRIALIVEWAYHQASQMRDPDMANWYRDRGLQLQSALDLSEHWRLTGERAGTPNALATGNANAEAALARQAGLVIELENLRDALDRVSA